MYRGLAGSGDLEPFEQQLRSEGWVKNSPLYVQETHGATFLHIANALWSATK